jgi:hypothetical protein
VGVGVALELVVAGAREASLDGVHLVVFRAQPLWVGGWRKWEMCEKRTILVVSNSVTVHSNSVTQQQTTTADRVS